MRRRRRPFAADVCMKSRHRTAILVLISLCVSCAYRSPAPAPALSSSLALYWLPSELRLGDTNLIGLELRNIGSEPVDICLVDSGVSLWMQIEDTGQWFPIIMHGAVLHEACWRQTRLLPGEAVTSCQRIGSNNLPLGLIQSQLTLGALVRLKRQHRSNAVGDPVETIRAPELVLAVDPSGEARAPAHNPSLQRTRFARR